MLEHSVEEHFMRRVEKARARAPKSERIARGFPDRMVFAPGGRVCFVELKRPGTDLDPMQVIQRNILLSLGFDYFKLNDIEEVHTWADSWFS